MVKSQNEMFSFFAKGLKWENGHVVSFTFKAGRNQLHLRIQTSFQSMLEKENKNTDVCDDPSAAARMFWKNKKEQKKKAWRESDCSPMKKNPHLYINTCLIS